MAAWKDLEKRLENLPEGVAWDAHYKTRFPKWLGACLDNVTTDSDQTPAAVLFERGRPTGDSLVVVRLEDFERLTGGAA